MINFNKMSKKELVKILDIVQELEGEAYIENVQESIRCESYTVDDIDKDKLDRIKYLSDKGFRNKQKNDSIELKSLLNEFKIEQIRAIANYCQVYIPGELKTKKDIIDRYDWQTIGLRVNFKVICDAAEESEFPKWYY